MQIISEESSKGRRVDRKHMSEKRGVAKVKDEKKNFCNATSMEQGGKITDV